MSFCVRSFSNSSKYVPTIVANAQGCVVRRYNSRQLAKHVKTPATSTFLNEFLGSNVPLASSLDIRDDKLSSESTNDACLELGSYQLDNDFSLNDGTVKKIYTFDDNFDSQSHEIIHVPFSKSAKDHLVFSDSLNIYENKISVIGSKNSCIYLDNITNFSTLDTTKDETKVFAAEPSSALKQKPSKSLATKKSSATDPEKKPSDNNLEHVYNTLSLDLPKLFVKTMDYSIYHPDVEFINNVKGTTVKGIYPYVKQLSLLRIFGHIKYAYVKMEILKITMHTQDNTIRVRWRINGITNMKIFFGFWRFKVWKIKEALKESESWYDGYSTFYVGDDGLVFKHVADKMMPDEEAEAVKPKATLTSKLASQLSA